MRARGRAGNIARTPGHYPRALEFSTYCARKARGRGAAGFVYAPNEIATRLRVFCVCVSLVSHNIVRIHAFVSPPRARSYSGFRPSVALLTGVKLPATRCQVQVRDIISREAVREYNARVHYVRGVCVREVLVREVSSQAN